MVDNFLDMLGEAMLIVLFIVTLGYVLYYGTLDEKSKLELIEEEENDEIEL